MFHFNWLPCDTHTALGPLKLTPADMLTNSHNVSFTPTALLPALFQYFSPNQIFHSQIADQCMHAAAVLEIEARHAASSISET